MKNGKLCFVDSSLFSFYPMLIKLLFFFLFLLFLLFVIFIISFIQLISKKKIKKSKNQKKSQLHFCRFHFHFTFQHLPFQVPTQLHSKHFNIYIPLPTHSTGGGYDFQSTTTLHFHFFFFSAVSRECVRERKSRAFYSFPFCP